MKWYIKGTEDEGLFIGEFMGLGFFEQSIRDGECSPDEEPVVFSNREEAETYLNSWSGGPAGCTVVSEEEIR